MRQFFSRHKYKLGAATVLAGIICLFILFKEPELPPDIEVGLVEHGEVVEIINETGTVQVTRSVDMAFERSGRVAAILAPEGSTVEAGAPLISLADAGPLSEYKAALARLEAEEIRLQELESGADMISLEITSSGVAGAELAVLNAEKNLANVTAQQDKLVENAKKTLLSTGLQAYLISGENVNSSNSFVSPIISGTYASNEEGTYTITVYRSNAPSGASFRFSGLEDGTAPVSTLSPIPLGTRGLYLQFPTDPAVRTTWEIPIPNVRSGNYINNQNAYEAVLEARNVAVSAAASALEIAKIQLTQANLELTKTGSSARAEKIDAQAALVRQMRALADQAKNSLDATVVIAPFDGTVTAVKTEVGEVVTPGAPVVSMISNDQHEVIVDISEVDIAELTVGDEAIVSLDAYPDIIFSATVTKITPSAIVVDGLKVFRVTLAFDQPNDLFKDGLTAEVDITTIFKPEVTKIPTRSIYEDEQGKFVRTIDSNNNIEKMRVQTGLRGTNGYTEIISGLHVGDRIITFATERSLEGLE